MAAAAVCELLTEPSCMNLETLFRGKTRIFKICFIILILRHVNSCPLDKSTSVFGVYPKSWGWLQRRGQRFNTRGAFRLPKWTHCGIKTITVLQKLKDSDTVSTAFCTWSFHYQPMNSPNANPLLRYSEMQTLSVWCEFVLNYNSFFSYNSHNRFSAASQFFFQFHFWFSFSCYSLKVDGAWVLLLNKVSFISEISWFLSKKPLAALFKTEKKPTLKYHQVWKGFIQKIPLC